MRPHFWKDFLRPVYGTIVFQPFALAWCWLMDMDYMTMVGPFIIYSTIVFIPIYSVYERLWRHYDRSWPNSECIS